MKRALLLVAVLAASAVIADGDQKKNEKGQKAAAQPDFSVVCSNAWLKCTTDKSPVDYAAGDEVKFEISFMGVTNTIPAGKYKLKWTAKGFDETEPEGSMELSNKPLVFKGKISAPGFARLDVRVVNADGKPFERIVGKRKSGVSIACGAGADVLSIAPPPEPKDLAKRIKDLKARLARVPFKKVERVEVPTPGLGGFVAYNVSVPCEGDQPVTGILCIPGGLAEGVKAPMRVEFVMCDPAKPQPMPASNRLTPGEAAFFVAYQLKPKAARDDDYCTALYLRVVRALQYARTIPEWNGRDIDVRGWDLSGTLALWAAGCGEGVTSVHCSLLSRNVSSETFDPAVMARAIPAECLVDITRVGLGDDVRPAKDVAEIWNAMKCDRKILWVQGGNGSVIPPYYKGRDKLWEKLRPMTYRNMDADHCKPVMAGCDNSFKDLEASLVDKVVLEVVFDYEKPGSIPVETLGQFRYKARQELHPLTMYVTMPTRKVKDKTWAKFVELQGKYASFPFYFDAGMALPAPDEMPWYRVVDTQGVLRYSGPKVEAARGAIVRCYASMPKPDPVFALAKPTLLKDDIAKFTKANLTGTRLYRAIDAVMRKYSKSAPDKSEEARRLLIGMRQALDTRLADIEKRFRERAGLAYSEMLALVKEWPEAESNHVVRNIRAFIAKHPEVEKLAKMEQELTYLRAWFPEKPSDVKKKDAMMSVLRTKAERFTKSKEARVQGEAMSIIADIDNPPSPPQNVQ